MDGRAECEGRPRPPGPPGPPAYLRETEGSAQRHFPGLSWGGTRHLWGAPFFPRHPIIISGAGRSSKVTIIPDHTVPWCPPSKKHRPPQRAPGTPARGGGSCLPSSEARAPGVAPAAIHPLRHVALVGTTLTERLLSEALWGAQGRAAACHAGHHGAAGGAPCRAHGVPQNLQGTENH